MNRLTAKNKNGGVYQPDTTSWTSVFLKLSMYEDTGLEPEEVQAMIQSSGARKVNEGEWVSYKDDDGRIRKKCSACGFGVSRSGKSTKFCPECGASMTNAV